MTVAVKIRESIMIKTFKSFKEMLAYVRHKDVEVKHKANECL